MNHTTTTLLLTPADFPGIPPEVIHAGLHGMGGDVPLLLPPHIYAECVRRAPRFVDLRHIKPYEFPKPRPTIIKTPSLGPTEMLAHSGAPSKYPPHPGRLTTLAAAITATAA